MAKSQKELKAQYAEIIKDHCTRKDGTFDEKWFKYLTKNAYIIAELTDGRLFIIDDPGIEKRFCFDDSRDYEGAIQMASYAAKSQDYFKEQNLRHFKSMIDAYTNQRRNYRIEYGDSYKSNQLVSINFNRNVWDEANHGDLVSQEDIAIIIEAYELAIVKHTNRIERYLKRYGMEHVRTWTYWGDR